MGQCSIWEVLHWISHQSSPAYAHTSTLWLVQTSINTNWMVGGSMLMCCFLADEAATAYSGQWLNGSMKQLGSSPLNQSSPAHYVSLCKHPLIPIGWLRLEVLCTLPMFCPRPSPSRLSRFHSQQTVTNNRRPFSPSSFFSIDVSHQKHRFEIYTLPTSNLPFPLDGLGPFHQQIILLQQQGRIHNNELVTSNSTTSTVFIIAYFKSV
jgi:hypothetical protein